MTTSTVPRIQINGAVDVTQNVMANINNIAANAQSWVTWDTTLAKWRIIPNAPAAPNYNYIFNDTTIIGGISVTGTPLERMYNAAEVTFNNTELRTGTDSIGIRLPLSERYPNESENTLTVNYSLINNPVHAQQLASIEVLQSRLDKIITFTTDYSSAGLVAGEVIGVTAPVYGYFNKLFRVTTVEEADTDDGGIAFTITAMEYNASVYAGNFTRDQRTKASEIIPFELNDCVQDSIADDTVEDILKTGACVLMDTFGSPTINMENDEVPTSMTDEDFYSDDVFNDVLGVFTRSDSFDPNQTQYRYDLGVSFTATRAGTYTINYQTSRATVYNTNTAGEIMTPDTFRTRWQLCLKKGDLFITKGVTSPNSERHLIPSGTAFPWRNNYVYLNENETVEFYMFYMTDFGNSNPDYGPGSRYGFNVIFNIYYCGNLNGY